MNKYTKKKGDYDEMSGHGHISVSEVLAAYYCGIKINEVWKK